MGGGVGDGRVEVWKSERVEEWKSGVLECWSFGAKLEFVSALLALNRYFAPSLQLDK
jgi:hypothetical protein